MAETSSLEEIYQMIEEQIEVDKNDEVEELSLDMVNIGRFSDELKKKFESYPNLASLSLNGCNLRSLENFPKLDELVRIELIDNKLTGKTLAPLKQYTTLQSISLGGNHIKSIEDLEALKELPNLFQLDLINNQITELENYRDLIFKTFPSVGILDNMNQQGKEVDYDDSDEEGAEDDLDDEEDSYDEELDKEFGEGEEDDDEDDDEEDDEEDDEDDDEDDEGAEQIQKKQKI